MAAEALPWETKLFWHYFTDISPLPISQQTLPAHAMTLLRALGSFHGSEHPAQGKPHPGPLREEELLPRVCPRLAQEGWAEQIKGHQGSQHQCWDTFLCQVMAKVHIHTKPCCPSILLSPLGGLSLFSLLVQGVEEERSGRQSSSLGSLCAC